jgi:hypothetical protein
VHLGAPIASSRCRNESDHTLSAPDHRNHGRVFSISRTKGRIRDDSPANDRLETRIRSRPTLFPVRFKDGAPASAAWRRGYSRRVDPSSSVEVEHMQVVEIRLKKLLRSLLQRGLRAEMARDLGMSWRKLNNICENQWRSISPRDLGLICDWLIQRGLGAGLPGALLGFRPSGLLQALAEPGLVTIYTGMYHPANDETGRSRSWVASEDAVAGDAIIELLSAATCQPECASDDGTPAPPRSVRYSKVYVPVHIVDDGARPEEHVGHDAKVAEKRYQEMRRSIPDSSAVMVGAPQTNYVVEHFTADAFGCEAFTSGQGRPPFYHRHRAPRVPSCCGGVELPVGCAVDAGPGIYFRTDDTHWEAFPCTRNGDDCGLALLRRDPGEGRTEMAICGCSGRSTAAMGELLRTSPDEFWPASNAEQCGRELLAYVVRFEFAQVAGTGHSDPRLRVRNKEVQMIDAGVVRRAAAN